MFKDPLTIILIIAFIAVFIWMQLLSHRETAPNDGGRHKFMRPRPPKDMLFDIPPVGSVVFGKYKGKYVCKPITVEGAILVSGGSGCGKSTTMVQLYLLNCNTIARRIYDKKADRL